MTQRWIMALYEYVCIEGHVQELSHPMTSEPEVFCGKCSGRMKKKFSLSGAIFKGSGWGKDN